MKNSCFRTFASSLVKRNKVNVKNSDSIEKNYLWVYTEKTNFGRKMRILKQPHSAKKFKRRDSLGYLKLQFVAKYQKIVWGLQTFPTFVQQSDY